MAARAEQELFRPFRERLQGRVSGLVENTGAPRHPIGPDRLADLTIFNFRHSTLREFRDGGALFVCVRVAPRTWDAAIDLVNAELRSSLGLPVSMPGGGIPAELSAPPAPTPVPLSDDERLAGCGIKVGHDASYPWAKIIVANRISRKGRTFPALIKELSDICPPAPASAESTLRTRVANIYKKIGDELEKFDAVKS
jgi:hypothetical protein